MINPWLQPWGGIIRLGYQVRIHGPHTTPTHNDMLFLVSEIRAYRYRFYPTEEQAHLLRRTFGCVRLTYNQILEWRVSQWQDHAKSVNYNAASARLTEIKKIEELSFLNEVSSVPLQQGLRHQQTAFRGFFDKRTGFPKFKSRRGTQTAEFTRSAFKWDGGTHGLTLAKMTEPLDIKWSRMIPKRCEPSTVTVSLDPAGRWHVSMLVEDPTIRPLPKLDRAIGVDLGLSTLATISGSDGVVEKISRPRWLDSEAKKLERDQRRLAKKCKGSKNRTKAKLKVARTHAQIADRRRDHLHKLTTRLIRENQTVILEDLSVRGMAGSLKLGRSVNDAALGEFRRQIEYKAQWHGRQVVLVDRWFPSTKRCFDCGFINKVALSDREWECPRCGTTHDRDVNAARNILAAGLAVSACGENVRPKRDNPANAVLVEAGTP